MGVGSNSCHPDVTPDHSERAGTPRRIFKFGVFDLRTETGELFKHGTRVKLQIKPLRVLETLLERPGELVTREELCKKLWPAGTFVDFESGLNTATNRLRAALGDSAESPRYIETLQRLGYRLICPVVEVEESRSASKATIPVPAPAAKESNWPSVAELAAPVMEPSFDVSHAGNAQVPARAISRVKQAVTIAVALLTLLFVFGYLYLHRLTRTRPVFQQLTFRSGNIDSGRFAPDSASVVYSATWGTAETQTYLLRLSDLGSRSVDFASGALESVSRQGELAFASHDAHWLHPIRLSRLPLTGGTPTVIAEGVKSADWAPSGLELALVRQEGVRSVLEFPAGREIYVSQGWISCPRVSPQGDQVAFFEHPIRDDTAGYVRVVDKKSRTWALTGQWNETDGLAWSPQGKEIWFTASKSGVRGVLYAVSRTTRLRQISDTPSSLRLLDISPAGRVLVANDEQRMTMMVSLSQGKPERDLSKFDASHVDDISPDGNLVLFTESGEAGGQHYTAYLHDHKREKTYAIMAGRGLAIAPDGSSVVTMDPRDRSALTITPIGPGKPFRVLGGGFEYQWARFLGSDKQLLVGGTYSNKRLIICIQKVSGGPPVPLRNSPYLDFVTVAPDGSRFAGVAPGRELKIFDIANQTVRHVEPCLGTFPIAWSNAGESLYAMTHRDSGYRILKMNLQPAKNEVWKAITPQTTDGFAGLASVAAAPSAGAYAYSSFFKSSHLYVVDGWS